jgi:hypothetical protein
MTPSEINREFATEVMGWHISRNPYGGSELYLFIDPPETHETHYTLAPIHRLMDFDPYHRWDHAAMGLEKMESKYHWVIKSPFEKGDTYMAGLTPLGVTGWNGRPDFIGQADTAPAAICLACIEAVKEKE